MATESPTIPASAVMPKLDRMIVVVAEMPRCDLPFGSLKGGVGPSTSRTASFVTPCIVRSPVTFNLPVPAASTFVDLKVIVGYLATSKKFSPRKPGLVKNATYECGLESKNDAFLRFRPEYYLYAIVFLIFDVEAIFLLPFAVAFSGLTLGAAVAMLVFLLLLVEGLVWTWRKGVLTWV